jgi:hypothetical protein
LTGLLQFLASLLSGPLINGVIAAYKARLDAQNSQDAHAADLVARDVTSEGLPPAPTGGRGGGQ